MGSISHFVGWLGNSAAHHHRAGGFASHSFERFAFFATSFLIYFIGTHGRNLKWFFTAFFPTDYSGFNWFEFKRKAVLALQAFF
jgi:hypothetical protein